MFSSMLLHMVYVLYDNIQNMWALQCGTTHQKYFKLNYLHNFYQEYSVFPHTYIILPTDCPTCYVYWGCASISCTAIGNIGKSQSWDKLATWENWKTQKYLKSLKIQIIVKTLLKGTKMQINFVEEGKFHCFWSFRLITNIFNRLIQFWGWLQYN